MENETPKSTFRLIVDGSEIATEPTLGESSDSFTPEAGTFIFGRKVKELDFSKLQTDWKQILGQIDSLATQADIPVDPQGKKKTFLLDEIDIGLTITAEGHLAFIASASASATLSMTFKRSK